MADPLLTTIGTVAVMTLAAATRNIYFTLADLWRIRHGLRRTL